MIRKPGVLGNLPPWPAVIAFAALAILAVLPVLSAHHLLLLDAPAHESRLAILHDLLTAKHGYPFYRLDTFFLPNIAFDAIGLGLTFFVSPEIAGRIFFALTLLLGFSGVVVLNRVAIGRWSLVPLACVLLLYNLVSILGFFSYAFGLALVPWALAARLKLENAPQIISLLLGAVLATILLFCHVFDFAIYAVMSSGFVLAALLQRRIGLGRAALRALEPVPAGLLFLLMSTGGASQPHYEPSFLTAKLFGIVKSVTSGSMAGDVAFLAGAAIFVLLVWRARPRLVTSFIPGLIVLVLLYFALPAKLASGSYVDSRMPIAVMLLAMAGLDVHIRRSTATTMLMMLFAAALIVKQGAVAVLWRSFDEPVDVLVRTFDALPAGSVIVQAECQPHAHDIREVYRQRQPSLSHIATMAAFENRRFVVGNYAIPGQQPIRIAPAYLPYFELQDALAEPNCTVNHSRKQLAHIEAFARAQKAAGHPTPPLYFFLVNPPGDQSLGAEAKLIANGANYELYAVRRPGPDIPGEQKKPPKAPLPQPAIGRPVP